MPRLASTVSSRKYYTIVNIILLMIGFWLAGCKPSQPVGTATIEPAVVLTAAAETAVYRLTQSLLTTPTAPLATQTLAASPTSLPVSGTTAAPTQGAATTTPTFSQGGLNERMQYVADLTIPDGTDFKPGESFTKTWRIKNAGASTWSTAYALVFFSGEKMGTNDRVNLSSAVPPAGTIDVSVNLTAPTQVGRYRGYWKLLNPAGKWIEETIYVEIDVVSAGAVTQTVGPTATNSGPTNVTNVSMAAAPQDYTGTCPYTFTYTGRFTLNQPDTVSYKLEAGSETPGFTFNLPGVQSVPFAAGEQVLNFNLEFTQSVKGWLRLHITAPVDVTSNQAEFELICQP